MGPVKSLKEIQDFLDRFLTIDEVIRSAENSDVFGNKIKTSKLICIIPSKNARKYYHITLYDNGVRCYYGRIKDDGKESSPQIFEKQFGTKRESEICFREKIDSKLYPPSGKDKYRLVEEYMEENE